ncbi:unnamed protein product [Prorocentrum cordatum]|uniref:Uncharacterized protein n=1 Tax=Prorocentrum cordatum TaxID=2364126 RepID=A0ABN9U2Y9_9DINO|nr:unnamed protein product [Polarella glacialis]
MRSVLDLPWRCSTSALLRLRIIRKDYMSFTCVYVGSKSNIYFGDSTSETAVASQNYQYICIGVLTSSVSSSTTRSSSATSSTTDNHERHVLADVVVSHDLILR